MSASRCPTGARNEVEERRRHDPIPRYEHWLEGEGHLDPDARKQVWHETAEDLEDSIRFAAASPDPDPATVLDHLYAGTRAAWSTL